jgi:molybdopterin/thiamine biosynthesis adenylyltransferase
MKEPSIKIKIRNDLRETMLKDLRRPHKFAAERIGFMLTTCKRFANGSYIIYATDYIPVDDSDYIRDKYVGASISSTAIRKAMQIVLDKNCGCFHIHLHDHKGNPSPSRTDLTGGVPQIIDSFLSVDDSQLHGMAILSADSIYVDIKGKEQKGFVKPKISSFVGYPMKFHFNESRKTKSSDIFKRQSFLGSESSFLFDNVKVGIIGFGGGGSHIGQQLAHIGIKNLTIFDDDKIEASNLNRLIGGWYSDIAKSTQKVKIAERLIKKILPKSKPNLVPEKWQNQPELLQQCDIIVGCVDSLIGRRELEAECRRHLIPYIDIGMDVHTIDGAPYMSGQVILSMPGMACFKCMNFLTEQNLAEEGKKYGDVGGLPQVVWPNGVLASSAVGILVDLITGWTKKQNRKVYLSYDGNIGIVEENARAEYSPACCEHYPLDQVGSVRFKKL